MREELQKQLEKRVQQCVSSIKPSNHTCPKIELKKESLARRSGEIVKAKAVGHIIQFGEVKDEVSSADYQIHFQYLIRQKGIFIMEEEIEERRAEFYKGVLVDDQEIIPNEIINEEEELLPRREAVEEDRVTYKYDRMKAVQYAERWWDRYNPSFKKFENNCTNYISQCLHAGGGPMRGFPNRGTGWWMRDQNWSYSWSVAHSFRLHLPSSNVGLRAKEVRGPDTLMLGDVICYDFQGDGRFDHITIVTGQDAVGMPLVNAHSTNSRMRYWSYEDSTAYTPNIKYKFLTLLDDDSEQPSFKKKQF